jgi:hypothetical protein
MARVMDQVSWVVGPPRRRRKVNARLAWLVRVALELSAGTGAGPVSRVADWNPVLPDDPDENLGLTAEVSGPVPWINRFTGSDDVWLSRTGAWIGDHTTRIAPLRVPLEEMTPMALAPLGHADRSADAPWALQVRHGAQTVRFDGPLVSLAWIAHVAGWSEPETPVLT